MSTHEDVMRDDGPNGSPEVGDLQRAALWRLLAHLYRKEVDATLAKRVLASGLLEAFAEAGFPVDPSAFEGEEALRSHRVQYARVFLGPRKHASPYGSVYHPLDTRRGQLWGSTTQWFRRFALDHGVTFKGPAYHGIPDHVGHELELYALLLQARARAAEAGDGERVARLSHSISLLHHRQLARWVPLFLDRVLEIAEPGSFYAQLAGLTRVLLDVEGELVGPAGEENAR